MGPWCRAAGDEAVHKVMIMWIPGDVQEVMKRYTTC
jgi:hypothetical protein